MHLQVDNHLLQGLDNSWLLMYAHGCLWINKQSHEWRRTHEAFISVFSVDRVREWAARQHPPLRKLKASGNSQHSKSEEEEQLFHLRVQQFVRENQLMHSTGIRPVSDVLCVDEMAIRWDEREGFVIAPAGTRRGLQHTDFSNAKGMYCLMHHAKARMTSSCNSRSASPTTHLMSMYVSVYGQWQQYTYTDTPYIHCTSTHATRALYRVVREFVHKKFQV